MKIFLKNLIVLIVFIFSISLIKAGESFGIDNFFEIKYQQDRHSQEYRKIKDKFLHNTNKNVQKNTVLSLDNISLAAEVEKSNYDVLKYDLFLDWSSILKVESASTAVRQYNGKMLMTVKILEDNVDSLEFDSEATRFNSVKINGDEVNLLYSETCYSNSPNILYLGKKYKSNDTFTIEFDYTHIGTKQLGFHFYATDTPSLPENVAYTMSEPDLARIWMPCKDRPYDKALSQISVRVPIGYDVISNGLLVDSLDDGENRTFIWQNNIPIPTYLMSVVASKYFKWRDYYKRIDNPNDSIEVSYYVWAQDMPEFNPLSKFQPRASMAKTVEMISFLSKMLGDYPFQKYSQAAVSPFPYGGMEHQSATTIHRNWLQNSSEVGILHEIGHQWLGDKVSCATWNDVWLNEGGATWTEWLWIGNQSGQKNYDSYIKMYTNSYLSKAPYINNQSIYGIPTDDLFTNQNVDLVYTKAGLVYNMLYKTLGEEFLQALTAMLEENKFTSMTSIQWRDALKKQLKNPPSEFDAFFDQWIIRPAHPIFNLSSYYEHKDGKYILNVNLEQIQKEILKNDVAEVFLSTFDLQISMGSTVVTKRVKVDKKNNEFTFELDKEPTDVNIDLSTIIAIVKKTPMGIKDDLIAENNGISVFPNPCADELATLRLYNVEGKANDNYNLIQSYQIYDITGNIVQEEKDIFKEITTINLANLSTGTYLIKVLSLSGILAHKLTVIH